MRGLFVRWIAWAVALAVAVLAGILPAAAARTEIGASVATCVARAAPGDTAAARLASPAGYDCASPQPAHGSGDYWVRSAPLNVRGDVAVRSASLWQDRSTLHALYADGHVAVRAMDSHGATRVLQLGAIFEHRLPARDAPLVRLLWHVEGSANMRGIVIDARVATFEESDRATLVLAALYAAFGGLCLALLVYNLSLWATLRHDFQLAYCAMVVAMGAYAFSSSGALAWAWPEIANNDRLRINYGTLSLAAASALMFARRFFEARVVAGRLGQSLDGAAIVILLGGLAFVIGSPWATPAFDMVYTLSYLPLGIVLAPLLWRAWRQRSNYLWLFALAWSMPISFTLVRVFANLGSIPSSFLIDNSTLLAMTFEALLSSLAVAYRFRVISRERDEARSLENAARLLADTDPLTGLLNRRAFLREAIGSHGAQQLILADVDHFKAVNETLGHDGGDEVLRAVARVLRTAAPAGALVARIGGEEFAIVCAAAVPAPPEELLAAVRAQRMPFDLSVTISLGTSIGMLTDEADWKTLYRRADQALFAAKAAGRDRARAADPVLLAAA